MAIWKEQFSAERDFVGSPPPTIRYLLCSAPRSGSHFLAGLLHETGLFGCPLEYFNPNNLPRWETRASEEDAEEVVPFLERIRTSPNGCFGMIVHYMQLQAVERHVSLARLVRDYRFIVLQRDDLLAQAISLVLAGQDGKFISETASPGGSLSGRPGDGYEYSRSMIQLHIRLIASNYARWIVVLDSLGAPYLRVAYEDVVNDRRRVLERIASFLGVDLPPSFSVPEPRTRRQRNPLKAEWKRRFISESRQPDTTLESIDLSRAGGLL